MRVLVAHFHHEFVVYHAFRNEAMAHAPQQNDPHWRDEHVQNDQERVDDHKVLVLGIITDDRRVLAEKGALVVVLECEAIERLELLGGHWRHHEVRQQQQ